MGKKALLIGIPSYLDESISNLPKIITEISKLSEILLSPDICKFDTSDLYYNVESIDKLKIIIEDFFLTTNRNNLSLLYIASHAIIIEDNLYILPKDYDQLHPLSTSLPISFISSCIHSCKSKSVLIIFDCCYSNLASWEFFSNKKFPFDTRHDEKMNLCIIASSRKDEPSIDGVKWG